MTKRSNNLAHNLQPKIDSDPFDGLADFIISPKKRAWKDESQRMWPRYRGNGEFEFIPGVFVEIERIYRPCILFSYRPYEVERVTIPTW